ncbi:MAG: RagB/SusD family nutrient uptake outer membrane protein, partial [Bacteroidales bacterium]
MKKYIYIAILLLTYSCELLDIDEHTGLEKEDVGKYYPRVTASLNYLYTLLPDDFTSVGNAPRSCASDDAVWVWNNNAIHRMNNGAWSATNEVDSYWSGGYEAIRASNLFLESYDPNLMDMYANEDPLELQNMTKFYKNYPYEARFLRAFFHFELAKRYGDIPLLTESLTIDEVNSQEKTTFEDLVGFIVEECDTLVKYLPVSYLTFSPAQTGRVTKGTAMALKAKALLFLASPLHNPTNDLQRWKDAAKASLDIMNLNTYGLFAGFFNFNALSSPELIFEKRFANFNSFESNNFPMGVEGGSSGMCPTQNLV